MDVGWVWVVDFGFDTLMRKDLLGLLFKRIPE